MEFRVHRLLLLFTLEHIEKAVKIPAHTNCLISINRNAWHRWWSKIIIVLTAAAAIVTCITLPFLHPGDSQGSLGRCFALIIAFTMVRFGQYQGQGLAPTWWETVCTTWGTASGS